MMNSSTDIGELAKALVKAQADIKNAEKSTVNSGLHNKYANLGDVRDACHDPFTQNGLVIVQCPMPSDDDCVHLETLLIHESGQWLASETAVPVAKGNPAVNAAQCVGSALTYARRYGMAAMAGITQEDDDGNSAGVAGQPRERASVPSRPAPAQSRQNAPQAASGQQSGDTPPPWYRFWKVVTTIPGLTEPNPQQPGKKKATSQWFHLAQKNKLPTAFSEWTDDQTAQAIDIALAWRDLQAQQPDLLSRPDVDDSFAGQ